MRYLFLIGLLVSLHVGYAQSLPQDYAFSNVGMTFLSVSTDARSGGMGDLGVATLPDAYSHQQNTAKYLFLDSGHKGGINLFYVPWLRKLVNDMSIAGASAHYKIGKRFVFWYRDHRFKRHNGNETPDDRYFILGKNEVVYRETLSSIDALGILLMPFGLDLFADGGGMLYAGYYGDWGNAAVYSAALTLPLAPAIATKGLADGSKAVIRSAKGLELVEAGQINWRTGMRLRLSLEWKSSPELLAKLEEDLVANPKLFDVLADDLKAEGAYAWRIVNSYPNLRKEPEILKAVSDLISNEKFSSSGLTPELLEGLISGNHGVGAEALAKLLSGYETLVASGTKFENIGAMITEFNKGSSFAEGERWIQRYMLEHPEEFKGRVLTFESRMKTGEKTRIVDVVIDANSTHPCYYEFKSVASIPPQNFAEQFLKDLEMAGGLSQIRWYFDGKKISKLDKEVFLKELEKVEISDKLIGKWTSNLQESSKESFLELIDDNFNIIFQIK